MEKDSIQYLINIELLKKFINESNYIVFLGGAGVSTESGIPDFRSGDGIYSAISKYGYTPEEILSRKFFLSHTEIFYDYYKNYLLYPGAVPNDAHILLAELEECGKVKAIITQNIDGLHTKAGSRNVLQMHGTVFRNYCMKCGDYYTLEYILQYNETVPKCSKCGNIVRPDVILYEESLKYKTLNSAINYVKSADMLIVGGTSLNVYPAAGLVNYYTGSKLVLINKSETSFDRLANLVIHDDISKVLRCCKNNNWSS